MPTVDHQPRRAPGDGAHLEGDAVAEPLPSPRFHSWQWRAGNALVSAFARAGIGPIALLTTTGHVTGRVHTVPVVPIDHAGTRWLVAPYGATAWVRNARATGTVTLRYGRRRHTYTVREVTATEAAPVLKLYVTIATKARRRFSTPVEAPAEAFAAEAATHPVFELRSLEPVEGGDR